MSEQTQEQAFDPGLVEQWERTEFEKLIPGARIQWDSLNHRYRDRESGFADSSIQSAWVVWKARAMLSAAPSPPAPDIAQSRTVVNTSLTQRQREIMEHSYPMYLEFWRKHAMGSKLPPSCLACGQSQKGLEDAAIHHAELPDIFICHACTEKLRAPPAKADDAPAFPPPHKAEQIAKDCGALLRRWCYQAKKSEGDNSFKILKGKTDDYLRRVGLQGSPLRQDEPEQATAPDIAQIRARFEAWAIRTGRTTMQQASAYDRGGDMFACWCAALGITP